MKKIGTALITLIVTGLCGIFLWLSVSFVHGALDMLDGEESLAGIVSDLEEGNLTYQGEASVVINEDKPFFTEDEFEDEIEEADGVSFYSELDELGRCGVAYARLSYELMPTEERGPIGAVKPSGWHTVKYPDLIEDLFLYNRCHLIGFQLSGENANERNLITGTRYLNVEGMLPYENQLARYIRGSKNHVLYRVTPVYEGKNLLASGVLMEAWSLEDHGAGICFNRYCFNVQPGIAIDYASGDSWEDSRSLSGEATIGTVDAEEQSPAERAPEEEFLTQMEKETAASSETAVEESVDNSDRFSLPMDSSYEGELDLILNRSSRKCHMPDCDSVADMAEHNKEAFHGTLAQVLQEDYQLCKRCFSN